MAAQVVKEWLMGRGRDDNDRVPSKKVGNACERRHGHIVDNVTVVRDLITPK